MQWPGKEKRISQKLEKLKIKGKIRKTSAKFSQTARSEHKHHSTIELFEIFHIGLNIANN